MTVLSTYVPTFHIKPPKHAHWSKTKECCTLMPVLDKQQICSGRSWKLKSQFLQPLGMRGWEERNRAGARQREVTKKAKRAFLLSLPLNGHSGHWPLWDVQGLHQMDLLIVCNNVVYWWVWSRPGRR